MFTDVLALDERHAYALASSDAASFSGPRAAGLAEESDKPYCMVRPGVACVEIFGPLMQSSGWWFDGHEAIRRRLENAARDPSVEVAAMRIRSPGGVVAGMLDAARAAKVAFVEAGKPLYAFGDEYAFSGGYIWGSIATGGIYIPDSGSLGSVGTITQIVSYARALDKEGIDVEVFRSGKRKARGGALEPIDGATKSEYQARVDYFAGLIVDFVAANRQLDPDRIWEHEARIYDGQAAVEAGLANGIMSFDAFLAMVEGEATKKKERRMQKVIVALAAAGFPLDGEKTEEAAAAKVELMASEIKQARSASVDARLEAAVEMGRISTAQAAEYRDLCADRVDGAAKVQRLIAASPAALPPAVKPQSGELTHRTEAAAGSAAVKISRVAALSAKGWENCTAAEREELASLDLAAFTAMGATFRASKQLTVTPSASVMPDAMKAN